MCEFREDFRGVSTEGGNAYFTVIIEPTNLLIYITTNLGRWSPFTLDLPCDHIDLSFLLRVGLYLCRFVTAPIYAREGPYTLSNNSKFYVTVS